MTLMQHMLEADALPDPRLLSPDDDPLVLFEDITEMIHIILLLRWGNSNLSQDSDTQATSPNQVDQV